MRPSQGLQRQRMAWFIPSSLRICCTFSIDFQGPMCSGRSPSLSQVSLQARIVQSKRERAPWTPTPHSSPALQAQPRAGVWSCCSFPLPPPLIRETPPPTSHPNPMPQPQETWPGHFPGLLLEPGSCVDELSRIRILSPSMLPEPGTVLRLGLPLCCCLPLDRGADSMERLVLLTSITTTSSLFVPLTFPGLPPFTIPSTETLIQGSLHPPGFAKRHAQVSDFLPCSSTMSASPAASRVVHSSKPFSHLRLSSDSLTWA